MQSITQKLVTVIIPCYNSAQFLDETISSLISQTYSNWECILVDDGSTDNTVDVVDKWLKSDSRFRYVYQRNAGLSAARNTGLGLAKGEIIQFLDADDFVHPRKFELQMNDLIDENVEISVCDYLPMDDVFKTFMSYRYKTPFLKKDSYMEDLIIKWQTSLSIPCHTVLFKTDIIRRHNISFNEALPNHEDWSFWVKLFYYSRGYSNNSVALATYRIRENSMSSDVEKMQHGYLAASTDILHFARSTGNSELINAASIKYDILCGKYKYKNLLELFVPPIVFKIKKNIVGAVKKYRENNIR